VTAEELAAHLTGAMTQWGDGYTDPDANGEQYRVRWAGTASDGTELFTVEPGPYAPGDRQVFNVTLKVELAGT
jgi:hypothetical protein